MALGQAWAEAQELAAPLLPPGSRIVPLAETATLGETSSGLFVTFGFAILVVFLVLAAQFESFVSAIIVMATVPLGLGCAVIAMVLTGTSLNVYSQIGLVLMVGIIAKNGILVVEFANQLRDHGAAVREAIEEACRIRLRPVMMTMAATILGGGAAAALLGRRRGGAGGAGVGDRGRAGARHAADAVPDAGGLSAARGAVEAAGGGSRGGSRTSCRGWASRRRTGCEPLSGASRQFRMR